MSAWDIKLGEVGCVDIEPKDGTFGKRPRKVVDGEQEGRGSA